MPFNGTADAITSVIRISNLHCSSCVHVIQETLAVLSPRPLSVQVSIVSQSITVNHFVALAPRSIQDALDDAGFEVWEAPGVPGRWDHLPPSLLSALQAGKRTKHLLQCGSCRGEEADLSDAREDEVDLKDAQLVPNRVSENSFPQSSSTVHDPPEYHSEKHQNVYASTQPDLPSEGPFRVTLSVGGMTCSSCSGTITRTVSDLPGVSEVVVSLLEKSATAVIQSKDTAAVVSEAIEDCGFEANIISVEPVSAGKVDEADKTRTLSLRVDGMFSTQCAEKIMTALQAFGSELTIIKPLTTHTDPILQVSYLPSPPALTVRSVIAAISGAKSPPYTVSTHQPPSLEELARNMQVREQTRLLQRLIFAFVVSIPTFIIGIVYMSLVGKDNKGRQYLMQPMWAGNASRTEWALFFLSTPIMFYSANIFHLRSIKEIRSLWRKGSSVPIIRRFTRFGSMNLLVSSGVSVAYFASCILLGLAATQEPDRMGGDTTTYFDSVVFLTFFLLTGRFLEAYSKSRTADAIKALGLLRPSEALLLVPRTGPTNGLYIPTKVSESSDFSKLDDLEKGDSEAEYGTLAAKPGVKIEKIDVGMLEVGDIVRVQSGSTPPADGTIVSGDDSAFDESSLTGESRLIKKFVGDQVFLGTINKSKMVDVRVDAIGGGTMLDHIMKVVREGQTKRAPIERLADLLTGYFVPIVTLIAILTWLVWLTLGLSGALPEDYKDIEVGGWPVWSLEFAIAVFVVACPCGIGLAAPTALLVGSGLAAKFGILARGGGEAFQEMAQLDVVVFDKTGTLTEGGDPRVSDARVLTPADRWEESVVLGIAAEIESASSHPLAIAIRQFCEANNALATTGTAFEEIAGRGLKAHFAAHRCTAIIGNEAWINEHHAHISAQVESKLDTWKSEAKSVVLLAIQDERSAGDHKYELAAIFAVSDPLRPEAPAVIAALQGQGIGTWMISGDNVTTAQAVAKMVGIPETNVIAGVLPHEKAEKIQWLQQVGTKRALSKWGRFGSKARLNDRCIVAMIGDGINDAPALTAADIGIAIGSGSDVAISSASFILVSSNLRCLLTLSDLSRTVFNRVKFNFLWAVMYNMAALPIAAGVAYPAGHVRLNPVWASLAMALSSVSVICSSLMLKLYKEPKI
jgi:Cu+-exporting ATPase